MGEWEGLTSDSRKRWNLNAEYWDDYMGEHSNQFHRELIRPYTEQLLHIKKGQVILDIGCGNGNFSRRIAELGGKVIAFDYSEKMIERAKLRSEKYESIEYKVIDATNEDSLLELGNNVFDSAVSNMALMDISDIKPLIKTVSRLLRTNGVFVFSIVHPCFQNPGMETGQETKEINGEIRIKNTVKISNYLTPQAYEEIGIKGQPVTHLMFHRTISYYIQLFVASGFMLDGLEEPSFKQDYQLGKFDWIDIPAVMIFRFRKV